jgi:hypothetical protein
LYGASSPANCAKNMPGPLIVFMDSSSPALESTLKLYPSLFTVTLDYSINESHSTNAGLNAG